MKWKNLFLALGLAALLATAGGCIFSPEDDSDVVEPEERPQALTTDIMMSNFEDIYEKMDADAYAAMLHEGYRTVLLAETIEEWAGGDRPLANDYFDRDAEVAIHTNMFNQLTGEDAEGRSVPPIESINVDQMTRVGTWTQVDPSEEYFGQQYPAAYSCRYDVLIHLNQPGSSRFEVNQAVVFYALKVGDIWLMLGQKGLE